MAVCECESGAQHRCCCNGPGGCADCTGPAQVLKELAAGQGLALLLGLPHEPPLAAVLDQLRRLRAPHAVLDQRQLAAGSISADWQGTDLYLDGQRISCEAVSGVYTRLTSWAELPEVAGSSRQLERARVLHESIEDWLEAGPAVVVNRTSANDSNHSKPYQLQIIRDYFDV